VSIRQQLGDRFVYIGGMPTHEVYANAYKALGVPTYSSAVFNFIPRTAIQFYNAYASGDQTTVSRIIDEFFLPYLAIRNKGEGYAVSIVKAGATVVGRSAGPVPEFNTAMLFFRRNRIGGVSVGDYTPAEAQSAWLEIVRRLDQVNRRPVVDSVFPFAEVKAAFARLAEGPMGKVLIRVS
jgi:hypothetical protein